MITLTSDYEHYMSQVKNLDKRLYREILYHEDVLRDTIHVALFDDMFVGICFLMKTATYLTIEEKESADTVCHVQGEFKALPGIEEEVEVSEVLLDAMKSDYESLQEKYSTRKLFLRLWCPTDAYAYYDFLSFHGFVPMAIMNRMTRDIGDYYDGLSGGPMESETGLPPSLNIQSLSLATEAEMENYMKANEAGFGVRDSEAELSYRMQYEEAKVWAVTQGKNVIASVTTWPNNSDCASTENIFCIPAFRRQGITKALLEKVLSELAALHYDEASLTVYGNNKEAMALYFALGFEIVGADFEMCYH